VAVLNCPGSLNSLCKDVTRHWKKLDDAITDDGVLGLFQRGAGEFLIKRDNFILMNSHLNLTERALAELACVRLKTPSPRVLLGGLGMGCTLRAALDVLGPRASVTVAELNPVIVRWCNGPLAELTRHAILDPRVTVEITDVAAVIRRSADSGIPFDAIILDLYEGTQQSNEIDNSNFYGVDALKRTFKALSPSGVLSVWTEELDVHFEGRLSGAGFKVERHRPGKGGPRHLVYLGLRD
jgi:spermidine synthase